MENPTKEQGRVRQQAVLDERVDFEQPTGIDQEQREDQEEQNSLKSPRAPVSQDQRQQEQIHQRPSSQTDESDIEE
jgi:hypothetical protein